MGRVAKPGVKPPKSVQTLVAELLGEDHVKNANNVPRLLISLRETKDEEALRGLEAYFVARLEAGDLDPLAGGADTALKPSSLSAYASWLARQYAAYKSTLIDLLESSGDTTLQTDILLAAMNVVAGARANAAAVFDDEYFRRLFTVLLTDNNAVEGSAFQAFLSNFREYSDVRFWMLRTIVTVCGAEERAHRDPSLSLQLAVLDVLLHVPPQLDPSSSPSWCGGMESGTVAAQEQGEGVKARRKRQRREEQGGDDTSKQLHVQWASARLQSKVYSEAWLALLRLRLSPVCHRRVLEALPVRVIPALPNPLLLCDYLTAALDLGGLSGILALNSIFTLVTRHGLEYPRFYERLYGLLTLQALQSRHRTRFFTLVDAFLASPLVPAYTAAAFCKRLARLALEAGPPGALVCIAFVHNLLRRHPACMQLLHRPADDEQGSEARDPYDATCPDPAQSQALASSLWEVSALKRHESPQVAVYALVLDKDLSQRAKTTEENFQDAVSASYASLFDAENKRRLKAVPTAFYRTQPTTVFGPGIMGELPGWTP